MPTTTTGGMMAVLLLALGVAEVASFGPAAWVRPFGAPSPHAVARAQLHAGRRPAVAAVRLSEGSAAAGGQEDAPPPEAKAEAGEAEGSAAAPADAKAGEKAAAEEEEEEEDLLSTPAFLKQKLKVLQKEEAEILAKTEEAKAEALEIGEEWADKRARLQGDFDNFKARHATQTLEAQLEARVKLLQEFLPVLDNFDRARGAIKPEGAAQEAANAQYQEMHTELMGALSELGMEKIEVRPCAVCPAVRRVPLPPWNGLRSLVDGRALRDEDARILAHGCGAW